MQSESGLTLIEALISVVIAAIVSSAAYGSYVVVNGFYRAHNDVTQLRQIGRQALEVIRRDAQLAGFEYLETRFAPITEPIRTVDGGRAGADTLFVVYEKCQDPAQTGIAAICDSGVNFARYLVRYELNGPCPANSRINRPRLCKTVFQCPAGASCTTPALPGNWRCRPALPGAPPTAPPCDTFPVADYVDDLQFALMDVEGAQLNPGGVPAIQLGAGAHSLDIGIITRTRGEHGNRNRQFAPPVTWLTVFNRNLQLPLNRTIRDWFETSVLIRNTNLATPPPST